MQNKYLLMWLESPMQSWGFDSKFDRRDTLDFPTKSGIFGLLCCALGAGGEQRELLECLAPMQLTILAYSRQKDQKLRDFHMVGAGYNTKDPFENQMVPKKSDGSKPTGSGVKLTYRYYLQNCAFAAVLEIPEELSENFANALQNPVWDLYLGRKCCIPTDLIYRGVFEDEHTAMTAANTLAAEKNLPFQFMVLDGEHQGEVISLNDVPLQFGTHKRYRQRYVTVSLQCPLQDS